VNDETKSPLAVALAAAQVELTDPGRDRKGQVRGKTDYRYVGLDGLLQTVRPVLSRHGIAISQPVEVKDGKHFVHTKLLHGSGETLDSWWELSWSGSPQDKGSEITYARRYSLEGLVGVAPTDEDDDARAATERHVEREKAEAPRAENRPTPQASISPWDAAVWGAPIAAKGEITIDDALWWAVGPGGKSHPKDLDDEGRHAALKWFLSAQGEEAVKAALHAMREDLQRAFFAKWSVEFPEPRKKDGVDDETIERVKASNEDNRRIVMRAWYGVDSVKAVPVRAAVRGERSVSWLRKVSQADFSAAVDEALGAAGEVAS
jgi:hypothetical protein